MDFGTILGLLLGIGLVGWGVSLHGNLFAFLDIPAAIIVFGGAFAATLIMFPLGKLWGLFNVTLKCFLSRSPDPYTEIQRFSELALKARRDGLLALENSLAEIQDPFLIRGLEMVIDAVSREKIEDSLFVELACIQERHAGSKRMYDQVAGMLPAFGMIGTVIGLVQMLNQLDDPTKIGAGMGLALVSTLYGLLGAHLIFLPLGVKLEARSREETVVREMMIRGICSLAEGDTPKSLESKLQSFLAPKARKQLAPA